MDKIINNNRIVLYGNKINKWVKIPTLLKGYFYLCFSIMSVFLLLLSYITWCTYKSSSDHIMHQLELESVRIEREIDTIFKDAAQIGTLIGKEIAKLNKPEDFNTIKNLLEKIIGLNISTVKFITGISNFGWLNAKGYEVLNIKQGIVQNPYDLSICRTYVEKCKKFPWTLQLSKPDYGTNSGIWIIPGGIGVVNDLGKYLGSIALGFNIEKLRDSIENQLKVSFTNFIILDENYNVIMHPNNTFIDSKEFFRDFFSRKQINFKKGRGILPHYLNIRNITYCFYYKMTNYPYIILVGWDKRAINNEFYSMALPRFLESLGLGIFCITLLYFFRKKIINPISELSQIAAVLSTGQTKVKIPRQTSIEMHNLAKSLLQIIRYIKRNIFIHSQLKKTYELSNVSDQTKEAFLRRINDELKRPLYSILWHSDFLIKFLKKEIFVNLSSEKQLEILLSIQESANDLYTLTTGMLNLSLVEVNSIIEYCLKVESKSAILKNIKLNIFLEENLPFLYADELRLKQIIVGIISLSIDSTHPGGCINIFNSLEIISKNKFLVITLEDNGFSFNKEDLIRISDNVNTKSVAHALSSADFNLGMIEKLIKMHEGQLEIRSLNQKGKQIILKLPYRTQSNINSYADKNSTLKEEYNKESNIYKIY